MENENKKTQLRIQDIVLLLATLFQISIFIIKAALPLALISAGLLPILLFNFLYKDSKKVKIITLSLMGVYLLENVIMTYLYSPNPHLPIILFIVEMIMDIAIIQKIILDIVIKEKNEEE